jgi:hypothetical protein
MWVRPVVAESLKRPLLTHSGRLEWTLSGHSGWDRGRRNWADSGPTRVASGRAGVRAKAVVPLRARNGLYGPEPKFRRACRPAALEANEASNLGRRKARDPMRFNQQSNEVIIVMRKHTVADRIASKNNLQASVETTRRLSTNIVDAPKRGRNEVCMPGLFRARRA